MHVLQNISIQKSALPIDQGRRVLKAEPYFDGNGALQIMVLDDLQQLRTYDIGTNQMLRATETRETDEGRLDLSHCMDFTIFGWQSSGVKKIIAATCPSRFTLLTNSSSQPMVSMHMPFEDSRILSVSVEEAHESGSDAEDEQNVLILVAAEGSHHHAPVLLLRATIVQPAGGGAVRAAVTPVCCSASPGGCGVLRSMSSSSTRLRHIPYCIGHDDGSGDIGIFKVPRARCDVQDEALFKQLVREQMRNDSSATSTFLDTCHTHLAAATSCVEALFILFLLLDVPNPPRGFIARSISRAQVKASL